MDKKEYYALTEVSIIIGASRAKCHLTYELTRY